MLTLAESYASNRFWRETMKNIALVSAGVALLMTGAVAHAETLRWARSGDVEWKFGRSP